MINNGFTALSHEELLEHVVRRVRNDTSSIDAVVVAGNYLHGDGFDTISLWPIDCIAITLEHEFPEMEFLRNAWRALADRHMTDFVRGNHGLDAPKSAQRDIVFDYGGRTYINPTLRFGRESEFYRGGRPRFNSKRGAQNEAAAITIPSMTPSEYRRIRAVFPNEPLLASCETWQEHVVEALASGNDSRAVIAVPVTRGALEAYRRRNSTASGLDVTIRRRPQTKLPAL